MNDYTKHVKEDLEFIFFPAGSYDQWKESDISEPRPQDGFCECCGKYISEIVPDERSYDGLVSDNAVRRLTRNIRPWAPYEEGVDYIVAHALDAWKDAGFKDVRKFMVEKYGETEGNAIADYIEEHGVIKDSFECPDCINLDHEKYYKNRAVQYQKAFAKKPFSFDLINF